MKALVTGANGLIGSHVVRALLAAGHSVRALVRPESNVTSIASLPIERALGDVRDASALFSAAEGCQWVFHTAAVFSYWGHTPEKLSEVAVLGTQNALEAAKRAGAERFVLTSSSVVCGSSLQAKARGEEDAPEGAEDVSYFASKAAQEREAFARAQKLGVPMVAACPTMTVGPDDYRLVPSNGLLVSYLKDWFRATYPGGCNIVHVEDVAQGHLLLAERGQPGERYLLGSENLEYSLIHRMVSELVGLPGPWFHANATGAYLTAMAMEAWAKLANSTPSTTREQAKTIGRFFWYRHDKARALGYSPRPARQALAEALAWLISSPHVPRELRKRLRPSSEVALARAKLHQREEAAA
jgi:dihydroflavonol-4-reductase